MGCNSNAVAIKIIPSKNSSGLYSSDNTCTHGEGITSENRCQQTHRCQNSVAGTH